MTKTNLKEIEKIAKEFNNDLNEVSKALKRVQSTKCRLKKQKFMADYDFKMEEVLKEEQILKEVRQLLDPKEKPVTMYEQSDVDMIEDYDELEKAIRSIQSKKTNSQFLTERIEDNYEYQNACRIEEMLKARREKIKPIDSRFVRKTDLQTIIDTIESSGNLSQERIVELLKNLI